MALGKVNPFTVKKVKSEKEIEVEILEYLTRKGIVAWKNNSIGVYDPVKKIYRKSKSRFMINGVSDILGILPNGKFLAVEVKTPSNKKRTKDQDNFISSINDNGGLAFYATSIKEVESRLVKYLVN